MKSEGKCPDLPVDSDLGIFRGLVGRLCVVGSDTSLGAFSLFKLSYGIAAARLGLIWRESWESAN